MFDQLRVEEGDIDQSKGGKPEFPGLGLAVASLVLGIISIPLSLVLIGGLCGLVGLVLAVVHLNKRYILRTMVWWGFGLSVAGLLAAIIVSIYVFGEIRDINETMTMLESQTFYEWIGKEAPDFTLTDIDGNQITLSQLKGRRVILDFWATWCPPCRREIPHFVKLRNRYDPNDLVIIGISSEDKKTITDFGKKRRINYTLVLEKDLPSPYSDVTSLPTTFCIDRNGIIRYVADGYHDFKELNTFVLALDRKDPNESPEGQ